MAKGTTVDFGSLFAIAPFVMRARLPILLRGRHGIGKSEVVYQLARVAGKVLGLKKDSLPVVERRASQMTEGDLLGLPSVADDSTKWNAPDWLKQACNEPVVLFMDEIDRAVTEVRQGIFQLTDSRSIAGWKLHPDTVIFGAINGGRHGAQYQVGEMDPAELSRWSVYDVEPSVEDFIKWGAENDNLHSFVRNFIIQNQVHLEHNGEFEPNKIYPSRRSWKRFNDVLVGGKLLDDPKTNCQMIYDIGSSFIGYEAAIAVRNYAEKYQSVVTVEDLLVEGKFDNTKDWKITDWNQWVEKFGTHELVKTKWNKKQLKNAATAFEKMPPEVAMAFFLKITPGCQENVIVGTQVLSDGLPLAIRITKYAGDQQKKEENKA